jgi:cysteine desulfurase
MSQDPIYLDHLSTTPCDPRVVEAMDPFWSGDFGNPASRTHAFGQRAAKAVEGARRQVASAIGADPRGIVFTSGATEANNLAILGRARASRSGGKSAGHVITCATEHRAVLDPCRALRREGFRVTELPVDGQGRLDPDTLAAAIESDTVLLSLMHANNEIGVVHDLAALSRVARECGVAVHSDAAQSVGKLPVDVGELGVDLLSLTAHKLYGPKGIGALYVRRGNPALRLEPLQFGGGHERGLRSGTLPAPLCVGLGVACEIAAAERETEAARLEELRELLWARLRDVPGVQLNGALEPRLPGNLNVGFAGVEGEALLLSLPELAVSSGSACTSAKPEPSHVLLALGRSPAEAGSALRFGLGRFTSPAEVERAAELVTGAVARLRRGR